MSLRHAVLAALSRQAMTGYEIARAFDQAYGYFWRASHQQIYRELGKLVEDDLVRFEVIEQEGRPNKKRYALTKAGRAAFAAWLAAPPDPLQLNNPLLVKIFAGGVANAAVLRDQLVQARAQHEALLAALKAIGAEHFAEPVETMPDAKRLEFLTLRQGFLMESAWLRWAREAEAALEAMTEGVSRSRPAKRRRGSA